MKMFFFNERPRTDQDGELPSRQSKRYETYARTGGPSARYELRHSTVTDEDSTRHSAIECLPRDSQRRHLVSIDLRHSASSDTHGLPLVHGQHAGSGGLLSRWQHAIRQSSTECGGLVVVLGLGVVLSVLLIIVVYTFRPVAARVPIKVKGADSGAYGYYVEPSWAPDPGGPWCQQSPPAVGWNLQACSSPALAQAGVMNLRVKALSYNLFWWNLYGQRHGNGGSASKLIQQANLEEPIDVIGFQECDDVGRVMQDALMQLDMSTYSPIDSVAIAFRSAAWELVNDGFDEVAEDKHINGQYFGRRVVVWVRLRHRVSGLVLLFVNHHGPLPINSGGQCEVATAYNLLRAIGLHAHPHDMIVLLGDFNADPTSVTVTELSKFLVHAFNGNSFGGIDHMFTTCGTVVNTTILDTGGSDHNAISAVFSPKSSNR